MKFTINAEFIKDGNAPDGIEITLPRRATKGSAGYDFIAYEKIAIPPNASVTVNTHLKCKMEDGWFLSIVPRSGLGFKYRVSLANTVGVIDSDYYSAEKGKGVIQIKLYNPGPNAVEIEKGKGLAQGIFLPYGIITGDTADGERNGEGFGSTSK